jgi:prepilin-type N-terminal cleavage/methylation domain-containing protein
MRNADFGLRNKKSKLMKFGVWNLESELRTQNPPPPFSFPSRGGWRGCRGFTLIEIIIVIVILCIASAITIKFLADSLRIYNMTVNQKTLLDEGKSALERMCRDIRDANTIIATGASSVAFTRTNATGTGQDSAGERIRFDLSGTTLRKVKGVALDGSGGTPYTLADNVTAFTVAYATYEIQLQLTLQLTSGENVILQTKVHPKNLPKDATYKNFYQYWMEAISS